MQIRPANLKDIEPLLAMEHSYATSEVWQLSVRDDVNERNATLRLSPLPREVKMPYPLDAAGLKRVVHRCDYMWVAFEPGVATLLGYLGIVLAPGQNAAWLSCACVQPSVRRRGIGRKLLDAAVTQAHSLRLHSVIADVQTKNVPASRWLEANNFKFSGFADRYYATQDIALLYSLRVR